jgi:hypothetical protein
MQQLAYVLRGRFNNAQQTTPFVLPRNRYRGTTLATTDLCWLEVGHRGSCFVAPMVVVKPIANGGCSERKERRAEGQLLPSEALIVQHHPLTSLSSVFFPAATSRPTSSLPMQSLAHLIRYVGQTRKPAVVACSEHPIQLLGLQLQQSLET